jgi:hypothetical protein
MINDMNNKPHNTRFALLMALAVVALVVVAFDHLRTQSAGSQEAAVLRMYAK